MLRVSQMLKIKLSVHLSTVKICKYFLVLCVYKVISVKPMFFNLMNFLKSFVFYKTFIFACK